MSSSFDPDDPAHTANATAARQPATSGAPIRTTILDTNPDATARRTNDHEDYIEAEYVGGAYDEPAHHAAIAVHDHDAASDHAPHHAHSSMRETLTRIPDALGALGRTLERAISAKDEYVVAVKITTEAQAKLEQLVQAGVFRSRAEAAAYLIDEGIGAQAALFARVDQKLAEIERLRAELRGLVHEDDAANDHA